MRAETLSRLLSDWRKLGYLAGWGRQWLIARPCVLDAVARGVR
ncbi:hypothetical protein [Cupriavidus pauculus]